MYLTQTLSPGIAVELWLFAMFVLLIATGIAFLHKHYTNQESFTNRQTAEIVTIVTHATDLITKNQSVSEQLAILETLNRIMSDESSEQIIKTRLSKLLTTLQESRLKQSLGNRK